MSAKFAVIRTIPRGRHHLHPEKPGVPCYCKEGREAVYAQALAAAGKQAEAGK